MASVGRISTVPPGNVARSGSIGQGLPMDKECVGLRTSIRPIIDFSDASKGTNPVDSIGATVHGKIHGRTALEKSLAW
jgi:hypothetical protein